MSIRVAVLSVAVIALCFYAFRNWFRALCGSLVLMAFLQHPDMPRSVFGILGLNLWNILFGAVCLAWLGARSAEGLEWDFPRSVRIAGMIYCAVVIWAFLRLLIDPTIYYANTPARTIVDYLVNPLKFLLPAVLLFDGLRSRERVVWALGAIMLLYLLLALQVLKYMGLHGHVSGSDLDYQAAKTIHNSVGYDRVDMSMMLAGASWAMIAFSRMAASRPIRWAMYAGAAMILLAQTLTAGRAGYVTWGLVGLTLCLLKWRKLLPLVPLAVAVVILFLPGVKERMLAGFGGQRGSTIYQTDSSQITSGRTNIWPFVIDRIEQAPLIGYGRLAMLRTGLSYTLLEEKGEEFAHPHNAYLELLFDNGIIGLVCVAPFYFLLLRKSLSLFCDRGDVVFEAAGGVAAALLLGLIFAACGAQTFYPREGVVGMWAALGVAVRVWAARERALAAGSLIETGPERFAESGLRPYSHPEMA